MINHSIFLPILVPLGAGILALFFQRSIAVQKWISGIAVWGIAIFSALLLYEIRHAGIQVSQAGNWPAPFGITLAVDLLGGIMLTITTVTAAASLMYAFRTIGEERERYFFYPMYLFILAGINGSFLTGDLFNLFVMFEILLMASYVLVVLGGHPYQLQEGFKYIVINILGSTLFVIAVALLYGLTSTLNMADLAVKVPQLEEKGLVQIIALLFLFVFGLKAAIFPLFFWLPRSYHAAPTAVTALFGGVLTKVGIYAIFRVFTLIFRFEDSFIPSLLLWLAAITMVIGVLGAISQMDFKRLLAYHIISQIGYMLMGLAFFTPIGIAAGIFHIIHNMIVKTALFLVGGATEETTGTTRLKEMSGLLGLSPGLAYLFFLAGISLAGIPPFSGFFSKYMLILAGLDRGEAVVVGVSLVVSIMTLFSMMKIFRYVYWGDPGKTRILRRPGILVLPACMLVLFSVLMGVCAQVVYDYTFAAAASMLDPNEYIEAVLNAKP